MYHIEKLRVHANVHNHAKLESSLNRTVQTPYQDMDCLHVCTFSVPARYIVYITNVCVVEENNKSLRPLEGKGNLASLGLSHIFGEVDRFRGQVPIGR